MKKRIFIISVLFIFLSIFVIGCESESKENVDMVGYEDEINDSQKEIYENEKEISNEDDEISKLKIDNEANINETTHDMELDIHYLTEERDYYQEFIDSYLLNLSEDELIKIALSEWTYSIYIENLEVEEEKIIIPENGIVNLNVSSFCIALVERTPAFPILRNYEDIFMKGSIDNYRSHINLMDDNKINWEESGRDGTVVTSKTYEISDLKKKSKCSNCFGANI